MVQRKVYTKRRARHIKHQAASVVLSLVFQSRISLFYVVTQGPTCKRQDLFFSSHYRFLYQHLSLYSFSSMPSYLSTTLQEATVSHAQLHSPLLELPWSSCRSISKVSFTHKYSFLPNYAIIIYFITVFITVFQILRICEDNF